MRAVTDFSDVLQEYVRQIVRDELTKGVAPPRPYSQKPGELPAGCGKIRYLRIWRRAADAGDAGAWSEGRARLMTADAWERWSRTARARETKAPAPPASGPSLLEELGGKRVAS